jgi:pimeloyl-ACP methyl ester carboxylesterase
VPEAMGVNMMAMSPAERYAALTNKPEIWEGRIPSGPDPAFEAARAREMQSMGQFIPGPFDPNLPATLANITAPTALLWGADDKIMPAGMAPYWQAALPGAPLTIFPDTGHLLFHERPETVAAIAEFVDSSRASR